MYRKPVLKMFNLNYAIINCGMSKLYKKLQNILLRVCYVANTNPTRDNKNVCIQKRILNFSDKLY